MDRRDFLKLSLKGAAALTIGKIETAEAAPISLYMGTLTPEDIATEKFSAAKALMEQQNQFPEELDFAIAQYFPSIRNLSGPARYNAAIKFLASDSRIELPKMADIQSLLTDKEGVAELHKAIAAIPYNVEGVDPRKREIGFFTYGDVQRSYRLRRSLAGKVTFELAHVISNSKNGYGNEIDPNAPSDSDHTYKNKTPLGLVRFVKMSRSHTLGLIGEAVSMKIPYRGDFIPRDINGRTHYFVHSRRGDTREHAEIITTSHRLVGNQCPIGRGADWHGTNKMDSLGALASGGCQRGADVDVKSLEPHILLGNVGKDGITVEGPATPLVIYASKEFQRSRPSTQVGSEVFVPLNGDRPSPQPEVRRPPRTEPGPRPRERFNPFDPFRSQ